MCTSALASPNLPFQEFPPTPPDAHALRHTCSRDGVGAFGRPSIRDDMATQNRVLNVD